MAVDFTCPLVPLRRAVERVAKIVERRNTIPILSNIGIRAEADGRITITGTDLDVWAIAGIDAGIATVNVAGETTVPATLFLDMLKKFAGDVAFAEKDAGKAKVSSGRSRITLHTLPISDLPEVTSMGETAASFSLTAATLKRIGDCCAFAISTEETRYYLNGIYLHADPLKDSRLTAVATDGHRLSRLVLPSVEVGGTMPGVIVPRKTVGLFDLIASTVAEGDNAEAIAVEVTAQKISFETRALRIVSKLIDGTFPDYIRVIPSMNALMVRVPREALGKAVERVSTISNERGRAVSCSFGTGEQLALTCRSPDAGTAEDSVPADGAFDEITIGFNARYLGDILGTFAGETVRFALADPGSPALLTDPEDDDRDVVLMPMRV